MRPVSDHRLPLKTSAAWPYATRLNSFRRDGRSVADAIRLAATTPGLDAIELNYPQHLNDLDDEALAGLLAETGLRLTGLNLRFEGRRFANGAFTSPDAGARADAIGIACEAVDLAARFGAGHVILWMADDGFDYPLQVDYDRLWQDEIDGFRQVALHNPAIRVSVEYKPVDPRRWALVRSMGESILAVRDVSLPNFGATIDFCHALMAGENPAAAAALALREGKLFGVHLNDGYGIADDGLMVASVRPVQTLELLLALQQGGYDGTIYFDTFPIREDPVGECAANIAAVERLRSAIDRLPVDQLADARASHDALAIDRLLREAGIV
jgi:xylose isomerase